MQSYGTASVKIRDGKIDGGGCGPPGPAIVWTDAVLSLGAQEWWANNVRHRDDDQPAIVTKTGHREWWVWGRRQRKGDKPAVVGCGDGYKREEWWDRGFPHREDGQPSVIHIGEQGTTRKWHFRGRPYRPDGGPTEEIKEDLFWHNTEGKLHRENAPAVVKKDGTQEWFLNGMRSNPSGPAIVHPDGSTEWYVDAKRHREGGLPAVEKSNGYCEWWVDDLRHREGDLPAVVDPVTGVKEWWHDGVRDREDNKPAIVRPNATKPKDKYEWWECGEPIQIIVVPVCFLEKEQRAALDSYAT